MSTDSKEASYRCSGLEIRNTALKTAYLAQLVER